MSVYKRFNGKRVRRGDSNYQRATWYMWFRVRGRKTPIHRSIPEAQTLKQALQAESYVKNQIFEQKYGLFSDTTTFKEFIDSVYLPFVEENNANVYSKKIYINVLIDYFGKMFIKEITPQQCRNFQTIRKNSITIHGRKRSPASVNKETSTLSKIFSLAIEEGKAKDNPMRFVKKLKSPGKRQRVLSPAEEKRFWKEVRKDSILYRLSLIAVHTGLRRGQILGLEIDKHIDFENGLIVALKSKGRDKRWLPLNRTMQNLFAQIKNEIVRGKIFPFKSFAKRWNNAMSKEKANLKDFRFHDLKHAFGTKLLKKGVSPERIQMFYGHSDLDVTEIYLHPDIETMREDVEKLD